MDELVIDVGVSTALEIDLSEFDFTDVSSAVLTIKNKPKYGEPVVAERSFSEAGVFPVVITPEESLKLKDGAVYDVDVIATDGRRFKATDNGSVIRRAAVGESDVS